MGTDELGAPGVDRHIGVRPHAPAALHTTPWRLPPSAFRAPPWREWLPVWVWAALVAGVLLLPYCRRAADEWHDWRFAGILRGPGDDLATHLSFVRQARDGRLLFEVKAAGADAAGHRIFNALFLLMGGTARLTGLSVMAVYHVERTVMVFFLLSVVYWFAGQFFQDRRMRWATLVLVSVSAGLEWTPVFGTLGGPEGDFIWNNTLWLMRDEVVTPAATALLLLTVARVWRALRQGGGLVRVGLLALAIAAVHPHELSTVAVVGLLTAGLELAASRRGERRAVLGRAARVAGAVALGAGPLLAWHAWVFFTDPAMSAYPRLVSPWLTARWPFYFGPNLALALVGAAAAIRRRERQAALPILWLAAMAVLLAQPYFHLRTLHLYNGLHVLICVLAVRGLWAVGRSAVRNAGIRDQGSGAGTISQNPRSIIQNPASAFTALGLAAYVTVASLTNALMLYDVLRPMRPPRHPIFLRADEFAALAWLDAHARGSDVVACRAETWMRVSVFTPCRVYVGDQDITPDFARRKAEMQTLFLEGPQPPEVVARLLQAAQADYIYADADCRVNNPKFLPPDGDLLGAGIPAESLDRVLIENGLAAKVFSNTWTAVYRVNRDAVRTFFARPRSKPTSAARKMGSDPLMSFRWGLTPFSGRRTPPTFPALPGPLERGIPFTK
jgi:hypothetical protein